MTAFKFRWLCDLLQKLEQNRVCKASAASRTFNPDNQVIVAWFNKHHAHIPRTGDAAVAFLSCMFPERRPDRVYSLQRKRLAFTVGRSLGLGTQRMRELNNWQEHDGADFPQCVETVMAQAEFDEPGPGQEITLEEIDQALDELAARSPFSSIATSSNCEPREAYAILNSLLHRLQSWEAKWLIRIILKNFNPVVIPERVAMDQFHFLLSDLLALQSSFKAAVLVLGRARICQLPPRPTKNCQAALKVGLMNDLVPQIGVMIHRPSDLKARSIKHCCDMAQNRRMSVERKYDGEYCQIHIDMTNGKDCIKIFSKSGKDSTVDRVRVHGLLKDCLGISAFEGRIKRQCILEGELLVYNDRTKAIEPFHKIRRHVQRSGRWLGNLADSPASLDEHLMIMFYDILMLDDDILLREPHEKRRRKLESLIRPSPGCAEIGTSEKINFASQRAPEQLRNAFAKAITQRWEGLVLKGCHDPYVSLNDGGRCIKLKKDYIPALGDTLDFAIVGGRRDAKVEQSLGLGKLSWTSFYIGCLENRAEVTRFDAKPLYRIVDILSEHNIPKDDILFLNARARFVQVPFAPCIEELEVRLDHKFVAKPTELFTQPFVAEVYGAGFDKSANSRIFTLRFPRVLKIHSDRKTTEVVSFAELQELGHSSTQVPVDVDSQQDREWIDRLEKADPKSRYIVDKSQSTSPGRSPGSTATASTPVTSNMRIKLRSPTLVRTDTSELSPGERLEREQTESSRLFRSQSVGRGSSVGVKRKLLSTGGTPDANLPSKKVKFLEMAHTLPRKLARTLVPDVDSCVIVSSPCTRATAQKNIAVRVGLKTTPPWCKWDGQEESSPSSPQPRDRSSSPIRSKDRGSHARSTTPKSAQPRPNYREPLSEIINISQEQSRYSIRLATEPSVNPPKKRGIPRFGRASPSAETRQKVTVGKLRPPNTPCGVAVLPTPPASSPADAGVEAAALTTKPDVIEPSSRAQGATPVPAPVQNPLLHGVNCVEGATTTSHHPHPMQAQGSTHHSDSPPTISPAFFPSPILLSTSLSHLSTHPTRPLETLLQHTPATFTYSTACFLDSIHTTVSNEEQPRPHIALVLVDTAHPDAVAHEMKRVLGELKKYFAVSEEAQAQAQAPTPRLRRGGQILFMDWKCLRARTEWLSSSGTAMHGTGMKKYFGGCLAWKWESRHEVDLLTLGNVRRGPHIRAIFSWAEAIRGLSPEGSKASSVERDGI